MEFSNLFRKYLFSILLCILTGASIGLMQGSPSSAVGTSPSATLAFVTNSTSYSNYLELNLSYVGRQSSGAKITELCLTIDGSVPIINVNTFRFPISVFYGTNNSQESQPNGYGCATNSSGFSAYPSYLSNLIKVDLGDLNDGNHQIGVTAKDNSGFTYPASSVNFQVRNLGPQISVGALPSGTISRTFNFSLSAIPDVNRKVSQICVYLDAAIAPEGSVQGTSSHLINGQQNYLFEDDFSSGCSYISGNNPGQQVFGELEIDSSKVSNGQHTLAIKVFDDKDKFRQSSSYTLQIRNVMVQITREPDPRKVFSVSGNFLISASANDSNQGAIRKWCLTLDGAIYQKETAYKNGSNSINYLQHQDVTFDTASGCYISTNTDLAEATWLLDIADLGNGPHQFGLSASTATLTSNFLTYNFEVENTAVPTISFTTPSPTQAIFGIKELHVEGSSDVLNKINSWCLYVDGLPIRDDVYSLPVGASNDLRASEVLSEGSCFTSDVKDIKFGSIALNTSLLGNGPHIFKIVATDTQDQITEKTYSFTTELPEVSFSNLISTISSDATFEALWIVPADSIRPINGYWKIDGVNVSSPEFDGNSGVDSLTLTQDQISVGSHQITYVLEFSDDDSKEINKTINIVAFAPKINVLGDLEDGPFPQGHKWKIQGQLIASGANPLPPSIKWRTKEYAGGWSKWSTIKLKNGKFSTTKAIFHNATLELYVPGVGPVPEETLTFDLGVYVSSKLTNTTRLWISPKIQKLNVSVNSSTSGRCTLTSNYQSNSASTTTTQTTSLTKGKGYFLVPTSFFNVYGPGNYIASVECAIAGLQTLSSGFSRAVW